MSGKILVTGAAGFVGGHLVDFLVRQGHAVRAVSSRPVENWLRVSTDAENVSLDLRDLANCQRAVKGVQWIYNLAAKVGGIGYIGSHQTDCFLSVLINTNLLRAAADVATLAGYLFCSSACIYGSSQVTIYETDPLAPSKGYGDEKLFSEKMCQAFSEEYEIPMRIVRPTCIYGPGDDIKGAENRDHVPSALCRKVIAAKRTNSPEIVVWGDGKQTRDFIYVHDLVEGMYLFQQKSGLLGAATLNFSEGSAQSVDDLLDIIETIAAYKTVRCYNLTAPEGVRHRRLSIQQLWKVLRWSPPTSIHAGLDSLYRDLWEKTK